MSSHSKIRFARREDAVSLLKIYAQYLDTPITFECRQPAAEEFAERIDTIAKEYPYLVWEVEGMTAGYAYAHRFHEREAYQWGAELSVYLDRNFTARGGGTILYGALLELLQMQGIKTAYGCVTVPNAASERLHEGLGFRRIGIYQNAGYKCGAWRDVAWFEKKLAAFPDKPEPITSFSAIPKERKKMILSRLIFDS